eukprot:CAMPEP_0197907450 /NCGR_PEP_ID=MMETSP1439-20131203/64895_1 /TAXON_ID=66791 /ORGANISM="Gonyaulax spinifera, Strain CCMP409" /LENGTH=326 /DNA_ID=CAMNT_0043528883 /DNA_START=18 /DNA_END=995 /DNA_ORIENTATION=-
MSFVLSKTRSQSMNSMVLFLQAFLLQAWDPRVPEQSLNMQCWFLSCLVFYWFLFGWMFKRIRGMRVLPLVSAMLLLFFVPWLCIIIPEAQGADLYWYNQHHFGHNQSLVDWKVVFLKFNPIPFLHVFVLGMLLAELRFNVDTKNSLAVMLMEAMAPLGYLGVALVFFFPAARPPAAKLSCRLFVLLPFQSMILLGLAGLPGKQPMVAKAVAGFNFLESYSYAVYVNQFICWHIWPSFHVGPLFFVFLPAVAVITVNFVQRPCEKFFRNSQWLLLLSAAIIGVLLVSLNFLPDGELDRTLPTKIAMGDQMRDVALPIRSIDDTDGSV